MQKQLSAETKTGGDSDLYLYAKFAEIKETDNSKNAEISNAAAPFRLFVFSAFS